MAEPQTTLVIRSLDELVKTLPQELQDEILDYTLAAEQEIVTITPDYHPPLRLAINRSFRKKFAKPYYEQSTFLFPLAAPDEYASSTGRFMAWIWSLADEHAALTKNIHLFVETHWFSSTRWIWRCISLRPSALQYRFERIGPDPPGLNSKYYKLIFRAHPDVLAGMVGRTEIGRLHNTLGQIRVRVKPK